MLQSKREVRAMIIMRTAAYFVLCLAHATIKTIKKTEQQHQQQQHYHGDNSSTELYSV